MKKIIVLLTFITAVFFVMNSCKKNNINGFPSADGLILGSYIQLDSVINSSLDFSNPAATVSIKVGGYKGKPVSSINIYVATGSNSADTTTWVLIKNVAYSNGLVLIVSTAELSAALAKASPAQVINPGTQYALENQVVTTDGQVYSIGNTPSVYNSFPAYNMAFTWHATAVCAFSASDAAGTYSVVRDDWEDYHLGTLVQVTAGPGANEVSVPIYPGPLGPGVNMVSAVVDVDPVSDIATINAQPTGYYGSVSPGNLATISGSGYVFSCTGYMTFVMNINVPNFGGLYSGYTFTLQKQ